MRVFKIYLYFLIHFIKFENKFTYSKKHTNARNEQLIARIDRLKNPSTNAFSFF